MKLTLLECDYELPREVKLIKRRMRKYGKLARDRVVIKSQKKSLRQQNKRFVEELYE